MRQIYSEHGRHLLKLFNDQAQAKREAKGWKVLGEHLFKKCANALFNSSFDDKFGDEFFHKLEEEEEPAKQKGEKK